MDNFIREEAEDDDLHELMDILWRCVDTFEEMFAKVSCVLLVCLSIFFVRK